jgi:hypothetical protein
MQNIITLLELFGGLVILFGFGYLIGRLLKIDKYYDNFQKERSKHLNYEN